MFRASLSLCLVVLLGSFIVQASVPSVALARGADAGPAVEVYVKIDEMAVLRGFRNRETEAFPKPGEPRYTEYKQRWQILVAQVFKEIRKRVPRHVAILPATEKKQHTGLHIDITVADMSTTCQGVDYFKYLWVRTYQKTTGMTSNWDGLGVRSHQVVSRAMSDEDRVKGDVDAWVQIWAQVPYLHVSMAKPDATPVTPAQKDNPKVTGQLGQGHTPAVAAPSQ